MKYINFKEEVAKYGKSLPPAAQVKARNTFEALVHNGRTIDWIYFAIKALGNTPFLDGCTLFTDSPYFIQRVDDMLSDYNYQVKRDKELAALEYETLYKPKAPTPIASKPKTNSDDWKEEFFKSCERDGIHFKSRNKKKAEPFHYNLDDVAAADIPDFNPN